MSALALPLAPRLGRGSRLAVLAVLLLATAGAAVAAGRPRIVSLAPSLTEIAYAAGAGPALVGTVEYSDYPAAARALPRVGDGWSVDAERVLALRPDVVLAWSSGTPQATIERLEAVGLRVVSVPTYRLADVPAALRQLGALAGTPQQAEAAAMGFEAGIRRLRERYAGARSVTVFIQIDDQPLYTVGGRHVISEVVELCGGRNVFADLPQVAPPGGPRVGAGAGSAGDPEHGRHGRRPCRGVAALAAARGGARGRGVLAARRPRGACDAEAG